MLMMAGFLEFPSISSRSNKSYNKNRILQKQLTFITSLFFSFIMQLKSGNFKPINVYFLLLELEHIKKHTSFAAPQSSFKIDNRQSTQTIKLLTRVFKFIASVIPRRVVRKCVRQLIYVFLTSSFFK